LIAWATIHQKDDLIMNLAKKLSVAVCVGMATAECVGQMRTFSVRDSIEMVTFSDPSGREPNSLAKASPDGKHFVVVTTHGIIKTNQVESNIWLIGSRATEKFLQSEDSNTPPPTLHLLATVIAIPVAPAFDSYAPVISDVRWKDDSTGIYYLAQDSHGQHRLCELSTTGKVPKELTPSGYDVEQYSIANDLAVYTTAHPGPSKNRDEAVSKQTRPWSASVLTGQSVFEAVFPQKWAKLLGPRMHELWWLRNGIAHRAADPSSRLAENDSSRSYQVLSISPSRRYVIRIQKVDQIPDSWESYKPAKGFENWRIKPGNSQAASPSSGFPARQYALVDLTNGRSIPLIDAPFGDVLAHFDVAQALWSEDGKRALVTNTFLPVQTDESSERQKRVQPCAAAVVEISSLDARCLVFDRNPGSPDSDTGAGPLRLTGALFGATKDEVMLQLDWPQDKRTQTEQYKCSNGKWSLAKLWSGDSAATRSIGPGAQIVIRIRQSLNDPPVLWATTPSTGQGKEIWNPNPQLATIRFGEASVYHWKDATGFEWTGGLVKPVDYVPGRRYPLVIQTHGFLDFAFMTDGQYATAMAARPLASAGIAVLQVATNYTHRSELNEAHDNVVGYEAAIDQLTSDGLIDPKRVGIIGFSRTCWYVESALIENTNRFAAASITDGIDHSYMQAMLYDLDRASEGQKIYDAKPFGEGLEKWIQFAPSFHLDRVNTPLMITAIAPDSILEEWEIYSSLYQQKKPVEFMLISDGQHLLQKPWDRLASQQDNVDWFRFWLQGYQRADPEDKDQYMRWRSLRDMERQSASKRPTNW
jgi:dipeptidyl aminopeptidase/acylaminoacyl peptidase